MENNHNIPAHRLSERKSDHVELAQKARTMSHEVDDRFNYEPLFFTHVSKEQTWPVNFCGYELSYPLWISSMTGGMNFAQKINERLATLAGKYKLGMGLGSCRPLLEGDDFLEDFQVRPFLGDGPLLANLGIAQIQEFILKDQVGKIHELVKRIEATGLMIHINPLQEWFQPGGDRYFISPLETISRFLETSTYPVYVKEVGQGLGPKSLEALMNLPIAGVEFGAFGGTNFSLLESLRARSSEIKMPLVNVGHTAANMVENLNKINTHGKEFIISGGQSSMLDAYEFKMKLQAPSVIGLASSFLRPAVISFETLEQHFLDMREALLTAKGILTLRNQNT